MGLAVAVLVVMAWAFSLIALLRLARRKGWGEWAKQGIIVGLALGLGIAGVIYKSLR